MPSQELIDTMLANQPPPAQAAPPPPWLARLTEAMSQQPGTVSEEESYRQMFDRDPALAGQMRMFGTSPITATPEENGRAALGMLPVTGNVIAAQDAYNSFGDLRKASKAGDVHEQRKAMAQMLMGVLGAMSPLPWGKTAGMMAKEAKDTAYAFPAWHGSPHDFDEFKLNKDTIGTGEGAQAYGHGLYFAENPTVAQEYRDKLSRQVSYGGNPVSAVHPLDNDLATATHAVSRHVADGLDPAQAIAKEAGDWRIAANPYLDAAKSDPSIAREAKERAESFLRVASHIEGLDPAAFKKNPGRLYHTEIDAEPHQLLDWDKRFSEQSPVIRKALAGVGVTEDSMVLQTRGRPATGEAAYLKLRRMLGGYDTASEKLREAGIPGIRYADQGSRGQGAGTSNYVIFDDKIVKIKGKE